MVSHQDLQNWQQSPVQGAISRESPFTPADESYLTETLIECRIKLEFAFSTAQSYTQLPDLSTALSDALTACREALAVLKDPQTYQE